MALVLAVQPDALVLCREPTRDHMHGLRGYKLPSLEALHAAHALCQGRQSELQGGRRFGQHAAHVRGLKATAYLAKIEADMGLPATDPFRFGAAEAGRRAGSDPENATRLRPRHPLWGRMRALP